MRGTVLQCGKFGCVVRLAGGRLALLPASEPDIEIVRRAAAGGRRPQFAFVIASDLGGRNVLRLARMEAETPQSISSAASLDQKIIDYLRQTEEWDPAGHLAQRAQSPEPSRADRLLPFESRARRQYRDDPKRPRRPSRR